MGRQALLSAIAASPLKAALAVAWALMVLLLPSHRHIWWSDLVHIQHFDAISCELTGQADTITAGALDPDATSACRML